MFKYIDNKTERSVEATIKTLATKEDLAKLKLDMAGEFANVRREASENKSENIKWMFIFWIGQVAAMLTIVLIYIKK